MSCKHIKEVYDDVQHGDYDYLLEEGSYSHTIDTPPYRAKMRRSSDEKEPWPLNWVPPPNLRLAKYNYSNIN